MLERELGKQNGGGSEPVTESSPGIESGLEQNSPTEMHMMSDTYIAQMAGLSWPTTTTKMGEVGAFVGATEAFGLGCELTSPSMPMSLTLDEHLGLGAVNPILPADVKISHLMLADLWVKQHVSFVVVYCD
jgi:hypothetical protein